MGRCCGNPPKELHQAERLLTLHGARRRPVYRVAMRLLTARAAPSLLDLTVEMRRNCGPKACTSGKRGVTSNFGWGVGSERTGGRMIPGLLKVGLNWKVGHGEPCPTPSIRLSGYPAKLRNCQRDPLDKAICVPMSSPETISSTRRLA